MAAICANRPAGIDVYRSQQNRDPADVSFGVSCG
jgi:hypothetical protein